LRITWNRHGLVKLGTILRRGHALPLFKQPKKVQNIAEATSGSEISIFASDYGFDGYREEIEYFADCIANDKPVDYNPPEQSLDVVRIALAQIKSADQGGERTLV